MSFGNCERCHDPDAQTQEYNLEKPNSIRRVNYCDACAQTTREGPYKLTGGKAPEAKPSEPDTVVEEDEPEEPAPEPETKPVSRGRRRN